MNILIHGCNGRMGQVITRLASSMTDVAIVCGVDSSATSSSNPNANTNANADVDVDVSVNVGVDVVAKDRSNSASNHNSYPVYSSLSDIVVPVATAVDVIIDFSNHTTVDALIEFSRKHQVGLVLCTTGYTVEEKDKILEAAKTLPIFNSGNMSIGINLLMSLLKQATSKLFAGNSTVAENNDSNNNSCKSDIHHDFDIEIIEKHHNQKLDAPSGTALMLADAINSALEEKMDYVYERESKMQKRSSHEIGIHSLRGGAIVGEHEVIFAGAGEVIELKHTALSRDVFGVGALKAAKFMYQKPAGLYNMQDVLEAN